MEQKQIISDPDIMMGKPVVAGTRITVELILEKLASGETIEQLLSAHPRLTQQNLKILLEKAILSRKICVKRKGDQIFVIHPDTAIVGSSLDIEGIDLNLAKEEIVEFIHNSRKYS